MISNSQYVVVKGKAGMGNRMLCALTGLLYAQLSGRRLIIDWSDFTYSNDGSNAFFRYFQSPLCDPDWAIPPTEAVWPEIWQGRLSESANNLLDDLDPDKHAKPTIYRKYSFDVGRLDYPQDVLVMWCFSHLIPRLRRHFPSKLPELVRLSDIQILTKLLNEQMTLADDLQQRVDGLAAELIEPGTIGVHVRFMDRRTSLQSFLREVDRLKEQTPEAPIFLATDNAEAQRVFRERYDKVRVTEKWFPEGGVSMHQNQECPDREVNAIEALTDMYLLARCSALVYPSSSTFSWISRLVSGLPEGQVIDVERRDPVIRAKKLARSLISR